MFVNQFKNEVGELFCKGLFANACHKIVPGSKIELCLLYNATNSSGNALIDKNYEFSLIFFFACSTSSRASSKSKF